MVLVIARCDLEDVSYNEGIAADSPGSVRGSPSVADNIVGGRLDGAARK